jgi:superfamily I DNA/RNA helicase
MRLQAKIGDAALVLTILQSKGMEFDDVILYNFFTESSCPSSIRCLGSLVNPTKEPFDSIKHAALCSELKHLYVAITRARITLSIR